MSARAFGLLTLLVAPSLAIAQEDLRTVAERSDYKATAKHGEVVALCQKLAERSKSVQLKELGKSTEGKSLPLLIVADPPVSTPEEAKASGKLVVLVIGNIHAGEVDGKEGLPMLVRELTDQPGAPLLKDLVLLVVPNYNPDGNDKIAKTNRPGQVGPEEGMGRRENGQGFDLNRDFVRLEAPETRALVRLMNQWDPHLFIDTHTTNGSYHRYTITYQGPINPAGDRQVISLSRDRMFPEVTDALKKATGLNAFFYGNFNRDHTRWETYGASPRFGTTYVGMRNRLSVLSEAYSYAPFKTRVLATRDFVRACLDYMAKNKDDVKRVLDEARSRTVAAGQDPKADDTVAIRSEAKPFADQVTILGFVESTENGRRKATEEPQDYKVQFVADFAPTLSVKRPFAYVVPARFQKAIEALQRHGIELDELREDRVLDVEAYTVDKLTKSDRAFQGHRINTLEATARNESRRIEAGSMIVRTGQALGTLAVYLLEPQSDDSLATWNFFDEDLKEGADFPVVRLPGKPSAGLLTVAARALPEDRKRESRLGAPAGPRGGGAGAGRRAGGGGGLNGSPTSVSWLDSAHLLQTRDGKRYKVDVETGAAEPHEGGAANSRLESGAAHPLLAGGREMTRTEGDKELISTSPDKKSIVFVRANDLWAADADGKNERRLTTGGSDRMRNGKADWVYFEEIYNRNWKAYWWSPDSKWVAFLQFDAAAVPMHAVLNDMGDRRVVENTPYPRAGEPNPRVRLGIAPVAGGEMMWIDPPGYARDNTVISEVGWWPDSSAVFAYVQDRAQTWLDFVRANVDGHEIKRLFRDQTKAWIESPGPPYFLEDGTFLIFSERDGWKHLYHYAPDGSLIRQLTKGEFEVRGLVRVDQKEGWIYYNGTMGNPIGSNFGRVRLDGTGQQRLTEGPGVHQVALGPEAKYFIDSVSDFSRPTRVAVYRTDGAKVRTLDSNPVYAISDDYKLAPTELVKIPARDGYELNAVLTVPPDLDPDKVYPVWFTTYGGPHFPTITDSFGGGRAADQAMAARGIVVFHMDPRSASGNGAVSAWTAYRQLGVQETKDISDAIEWLKKKPFVDGSRIGMAGHSYGGYITAYAMTHTELFSCGIAGAPVTDWRDYDSIYTERFMNTPQDNPSGYDVSSVVKAAKNLHGRLLILHGAIDDNVSLRNTIKFINALQQADKDFELMIYPGARHGIFGQHYQRIQQEFIQKNLGGPKPRTASGSPSANGKPTTAAP